MPGFSQLEKSLTQNDPSSMIVDLIHRLSRASVFLGSQRALFGRVLIHDRAHLLRHSPTAMFFYNQRAIFFALSGLFLLTNLLYFILTSAAPEVWHSLFALLSAWAIAFCLTLYFHVHFLSTLNNWAEAGIEGDLPPFFRRYFLIDFFVIYSAIVIARLFLSVHLDGLIFLLLANTFVYSAYRGTRKSGFVLVLCGFLFWGLVIFLAAEIWKGDPAHYFRDLSTIIFFGSFVGLFFATIGPITTISDLRAEQEKITQRRLQLLGLFETVLSDPGSTDSSSPRGGSEDSANGDSTLDNDSNKPSPTKRGYFREKATAVLQQLCSPEEPFWYSSACLWLREGHRDRRDLLLPAATYDFEEANDHLNGISPNKGYFDYPDVIILPSLKYRFGNDDRSPAFRKGLDAPAACVPLILRGQRVGVLALYGNPAGPPVHVEDRAFLRSLGFIVANSLEQSQRRHRSAAEAELDNLLRVASLKEVFNSAVMILKRYLVAKGCMVIFREDPNLPQLRIAAQVGFDKDVLGMDYEIGKGETERCAETGNVIRIDDAKRHRKSFDQERLRTLERYHRDAIRSWMAIPIGPPSENYGVIKVVNRDFRCDWFTDDDQRLGENLALRLQVIFQRFMHLRRTEDASREAKQLARKAEIEAKARQNDIMNVTHQLQGPLVSVIGSTTLLKKRYSSQPLRRDLQRLEDHVEDALALCNGTFLSLARATGKELSLGSKDINVFDEAKLLVERLQSTNSRGDLAFEYRREPGFPIIRIDRDLFISVMYTLIHNAMKYAQPRSRVIIECGFEGPSEEPALKLKTLGPCIQLHERDLIFEKFERGYMVKTTGRYHRGVGLGLWVARQLIEEVGGNIRLELSPEHPNLAVFAVRFPHASEGT
ncbi:MAG: GAF domain-containing protein [Deltaproteobacteria bacterium]|nr:GAF domain-containing protein [Deltaproteobacteria bacterium]